MPMPKRGAPVTKPEILLPLPSRERLIETAVRMLPPADLAYLREAIARAQDWGLGHEFLEREDVRPHCERIRANFRQLSEEGEAPVLEASAA